MKTKLRGVLLAAMMIAVCAAGVPAQRKNAAKTKPVQAKKPIVFAVLMDGERIEPIGEIDRGEIKQTMTGDGDAASLQKFSQTFYKPKTVYNLIFGAAKNGTVSIERSNPNSDCSKNAATVSIVSPKANLKGFVMGLATDQAPAKIVSGVRRLPTAAERSEIESLVRAEFAKQKVSASAVKNMKYHNLTALDVDNDKNAELVGTFWAANSENERNLLFFISEKAADGKYFFNFTQYEKVLKDDVMSEDFSALDDEGIRHELLLDALDTDGDSAAEIFTLSKAFEGYNYHVYSRRSGKWTRVYETYNYHCAF